MKMGMGMVMHSNKGYQNRWHDRNDHGGARDATQFTNSSCDGMCAYARAFTTPYSLISSVGMIIP